MRKFIEKLKTLSRFRKILLFMIFANLIFYIYLQINVTGDLGKNLRTASLIFNVLVVVAVQGVNIRAGLKMPDPRLTKKDQD